MNILEINKLSKRFGKKEVLNSLDMVVPEHTIYGFVGQNGAGKTTTMKIVLGLLRAESGSVSVCGEQVKYGDSRTNRHIGYLPDVPEFYAYMKPMEYLRLCGEIIGMSKHEVQMKGGELLELVGLANEERKVRTFSRGMKQRLGIAQALLGEPKLLICDEPTSALDPIGRNQILEILTAIKGKTTVVFSTHILSDVERICDEVAFLHKGKLVLQGSLSGITRKYSSDGIYLVFKNVHELHRISNSSELAVFNMEITEDKTSMMVSFDDLDVGGNLLMRVLLEHEIVPLKFEKTEKSLEGIFEEVIK